MPTILSSGVVAKFRFPVVRNALWVFQSGSVIESARSIIYMGFSAGREDGKERLTEI